MTQDFWAYESRKAVKPGARGEEAWPQPHALASQLVHRAAQITRESNSGAREQRLSEARMRGFIERRRDDGELERMRCELQRSNEDLQRLFMAQDAIQEDERRRIARELHDDLQQKLAAIRIDIGMAMERLSADTTGAVPLLAEVDALALDALVSTRRIVQGLRPPILEDLGLPEALAALGKQMRRHAGLDCRLQVDEKAVPASPAVVSCLYRVAQEALNNALKHARATELRIVLERTQPGMATLRITDNGCGMAAQDERKPDSFGLLGLRERVRAVRGTMLIRSAAGEGTTVAVSVPMGKALAAPGFAI